MVSAEWIVLPQHKGREIREILCKINLKYSIRQTRLHSGMAGHSLILI